MVASKSVNKNNKLKLRLEKRVLNLSFAGSVLFMIAEGIMAYVTHSHSILMDCIFDMAELIMIGPFLVLVPLLYKPVTEDRPYGFSQVESLFLLIKYGVLLGLTVDLVVQNIKLIMRGGHKVNAGMVSIFEFAVFAFCLLIYIILSYLSRKYESVTIKAELYIWKLDVLASLAVSFAFLLQIFLQRTSFGWIDRYADPVIAVVMSVCLSVEPVKMIFTSIKKLVLFAPKQEVMDEIRSTAKNKLDKYAFYLTFLDVIQTGRKTWVELYIGSHDKLINVESMHQARNEIREELRSQFDQLYIELIPELPDK